MAENIINKDLVTLYRGQSMFGPSRYLQMANQGTPTIMGGSTQGLTTNQLSKLAGQYYTTDLPVAEKYAGKTGKILSTQVPSNYVNESGRFNRFQNKVTGLPSGNYTNAGVSGNSYLVPKSTLKNYPSKINIGKTISNYMGNLDYPGKVIKAGYDLGQYGPGGVLKEIGSEGLGFLKNNAIKGLTTLGSLPVQAALMTLNSTPANASEANMSPEDFRALGEAEGMTFGSSPITSSPFVDAGRDFSMFDQARMGNSRTNVQGMDLEMDPAAQEGFLNPDIQPSQNMFQRAGSAIKEGIGSIRDFAVDKGMSGKNLLGTGLAYTAGLPGIVGSGAMSLLGGLSNMFERRDGMATVDEFGNLISGADLDKQNALGGYYTDAARASRRRGKSIQTMLARQTKEGLSRLGEKRLAKLLADQKKQDDARQAAFNSIMSQGNNQQSFYDSLNQGSGSTAVSGNPNTSGAGDAPGYSGPTTFADGGLASMFRQKR